VRRALLIGVSALAVALAGAAATRSAPQAAPKQVSCRQSLVIVLFWPHGHGAIPSVGFSADRKPHVEIYKYGTRGYPRGNFLAYGAANGKTRFGAACKTKIAVPAVGPIPSRLTAKKARAFSCRVPKNALLRMRPIKNGFQIDLGSPPPLGSPGERIVSAKLHAQGSVVDFSRGSCNPGPPPR
jgi:hypothetical protein